MAFDELSENMAAPASRRAFVATGAKLAYAVPAIAATMKLDLTGAGAVSAPTDCDACNSNHTCGTPNCYCATTTENTKFCHFVSQCGDVCENTAACPDGYVCVVTDGCCFGPTSCIPLADACGSNGDNVQRARIQGNGLTLPPL